MKKISTAAALLAAGALLFGSLIVACSPHGTGIIDAPTPTPKPSPASEEEDNGQPVDGSWDFTGTDTYSIGIDDTIVTDKALANPTAKGAKLSVKGNLKWGNGSDDPKDFSFWFKKASAYAEGKAASKASGYLTLTTENKANLTLVYQGGGSAEDKRWIAVCDSTDKLFSTEALVQNLASADGYKTLTLKNLKKGTYKIYASGSRIRSLQITNQAFESKTADVTNDVATLGLVATGVRNSDETIATGEVKDGKIVITSKKEGSAMVYAGTSETVYATINVTVSSTGAITTNIIKYVAFTAATNDTTANDVATLGLVGTSVASSAEEYVTADLTTTTGKITIKSVKAPGDSAKNVTITVTDAAGKTATIPVTEDRDGSLTVGTITKYERNAPVKDTDYTVAALVLTATNPIEYSTDAGSTWIALAANANYTATQNGSVKVRFAANDSYAASKDASVQLTDGNGGSVVYELDIATIVEKGNVSASSAELSATTGVTKIWASASGKSIQAFTANPSFVKMTGGGANVTTNSEYGLEVKIDATATVTITALTKQTKTAGQWVLKGAANGVSDVESSGTPAVASTELKTNVLSQDTTPATLTFSNVPAGTYILGPKSDGGYLFSLNITY